MALPDTFASLGRIPSRRQLTSPRSVKYFVARRAAIRVDASRDGAERLALMLPGADAPITPTCWSFGQLARLIGAPAAYLRQLPAPLAGINLQYGLTSHRANSVLSVKEAEFSVLLR